MSNIKHSLLSFSILASVLAGVLMIAGNGSIIVTAELTGQGGTIVERAIPPVILMQGDLHMAPPVESLLQGAQTQMFIGMLFVAVAFLLYALLLIHGDRRVRITVKPPELTKRPQMHREGRQGPKWFWVEIQI